MILTQTRPRPTAFVAVSQLLGGRRDRTNAVLRAQPDAALRTLLLTLPGEDIRDSGPLSSAFAGTCLGSRRLLSSRRRQHRHHSFRGNWSCRAGSWTEMLLSERQPQWVLVSKAAELTGYSEDAIRTKTKRGVWRFGEVWRRAPDRRLVINITAVEAWMLSNRRSVSS